MADPDDLQALRDGDDDLVGRDFSDADLREFKVSNRNFSEANFHKTILSNCDLSNSVFEGGLVDGTKFVGAILHDAHIRGAATKADFTGAKFRGAKVSAILTQCVFNEADLRGATFSDSHISHYNDFTGAIVDETTDFSRVRISRPDARHPAFRFFEVKQGLLSRRPGPTAEPAVFTLTAHPTAEQLPSEPAEIELTPNAPTDEQSPPQPAEIALAPGRPSDVVEGGSATVYVGGALYKRRRLVIGPRPSDEESQDEGGITSAEDDGQARVDLAALTAQIEDAVRMMKQLAPAKENETVSWAGIGHNNPPEIAPLTAAQMDEVASALDDIRTEVTAPVADGQKVQRATSVLSRATGVILKWAGHQINLCAEEFAKGVGKNLSDPVKLAAAWALFSGGLTAIIELAKVMIGGG